MNSAEYRKQLGQRGESMAAKFFEKKGYRILERNYHAQGGEIDLIVYDSSLEEYVFVEVKTRTNEAFGSGKESITPQKIKKILRAAQSYFLKKCDMDEIPDFRIDALILKIKGTKVLFEYLENIGYEE